MSVRKAQTDFFSPMTGDVFRDNRRRADLIMDAAKVEMIKTDDPFTQVKEKRRYYSPDDPASITDAFDRDYGVLSDEEAATILEQNQEAIQQPTPVINPEPTPTPDPEPTANPILQIAQAALEQSRITPQQKRSGRGGNKTAQQKANLAKNRAKAKAMAKARKASSSSSSKSSSKSGGTSGGSRGSRSKSQGRGGARGGSTGGRGASSKGGTGSGRSSQGRGGARGGSTGGRGASSKGGVSRGGARTNRSRSRRRCDIRCKFDVSLLTNMNLVNDDLATLAYFVRNIKK